MGSWNATCAISNLHITAGQDVVVLLLGKNHSEKSACYSNMLYEVCPMPFYGKYDDYGGVEECHGVGLDFVVTAMKSQLYKFGQGANEFHDIEVNRDNFDIVKLFEADHEERLGIDEPRYWNPDEYAHRQLQNEENLSDSQQYELDRLANKIKKVDGFRRVTHIQIHAEIFRHIMEKWYITEYLGQGKGDFGYKNSYRKLYFSDIVGSIPEYIERMKKAVEDEEETRESLKDANLTKEQRHRLTKILLRDIFEYNDPCLAGRWMEGMKRVGEGSPWFLIDPQEITSGFFASGNWEKLAAVVKDMLSIAWLNAFMASTRRMWVPTIGAGSQNSETLGYKVLANAVLETLEEERKQYLKDIGEDDTGEEE